MKKRHTEEQIIGILNEAQAGMPVADLLRKHNIAQGTFYRWPADRFRLWRCGAIGARSVSISATARGV